MHEALFSSLPGRVFAALVQVFVHNFPKVRALEAATDNVDKVTRSRIMSAVRGKNTKPELALRRALHARGFRFRLHAGKVRGRPDLVLPKYRAVVFVHGCFWHRHQGCRYATIPSTRSEFWQAKFDANVARDSAVRRKLLEDGWRVATVWECALRKQEQVGASIGLLAVWLPVGRTTIEIGVSDIPHCGIIAAD